MVIDDNQDFAQVMKTLLELDGHQIELAFDGRNALAAIRSYRPDIVLVDLGLPGIDGFQVAAQVRAEPGLSGIHLVALTGYGRAEDVRQSREAGFERHLTKPIDREALQAVIGECCRRGVRS